MRPNNLMPINRCSAQDGLFFCEYITVSVAQWIARQTSDLMVRDPIAEWPISFVRM
jgi:hypothetical protein